MNWKGSKWTIYNDLLFFHPALLKPLFTQIVFHSVQNDGRKQLQRGVFHNKGFFIFQAGESTSYREIGFYLQWLKCTVLWVTFHHAVWYNHIPVVLYIRAHVFWSLAQYNPGVLWKVCSLASDCTPGKALHCCCISLATDNTDLIQEEGKDSHFLPEAYPDHLLCPSRAYSQKHRQLIFVQSLRKVTCTWPLCA